MDTQKIGKFLKELRKQNNMTQEQLGEKIGVTNKTISKWEEFVKAIVIYLFHCLINAQSPF